MNDKAPFVNKYSDKRDIFVHIYVDYMVMGKGQERRNLQ